MKNAGNVNVSSEEEVVWFTVSLGKTKRGETSESGITRVHRKYLVTFNCADLV